MPHDTNTGFGELDPVEIWAELARAARKHRHGWHLGVLAMAGPTAHNVTLRGADAGRRWLWCHTDRRSSKAKQDGARAEWLFYCRQLGRQVRVAGSLTVLIEGEAVDAAWAKTKMLARRCYLAAQGPGTASEGPSAGYPDEFADREPTPKESEAGRANFAVLRLEADGMDMMQTAFTGHRRAKATWTGTVWAAEWVTP